MLCIKSLRTACGDRPTVTVYCPDNLPPPSGPALRFYDHHRVRTVSFHNEFLPDRVDDLGGVPARHLTCNKLYCLQGIPPGERRVFLDADIVFLGDPSAYLESIAEPCGASPVNTPEAFGGDWRTLYESVGVPYPDHEIEVWTTYAYGKAPQPPRTKMVPYFSSGIVYATSTSSLPELWLQLARELEGKLHLFSRTFFLDQIALSVAMLKTGEPYQLIPRELNATFEILRFLERPAQLFHYVTLDALAAAVARFPEVRRVMTKVVRDLAREDGLDMRFSLLTEVPRLYRRAVGLAARPLNRLLGTRLAGAKERT